MPSEYTGPVEISASVAEANRKAAERLREGGSQDFEDAQRGLLAQPDVPAIHSRTDSGKVVWSFTAYDFLTDGDEQAPPTVNPSLWRQGRLTAVAGLFQVTSGTRGAVYQVRGYDLSNMTIIEGDRGIIVIDPLACYETAQAALKLYRDTTGNRNPVRALIYTHSHVDHFGGARGLFAERDDEVPADLTVIAPDGFLEHAVSENVYAGPAMQRRAEYMYAAELDKSPYAQVGSGLGLTVSTGEVTLLPPTDYIGSAQAVTADDWSPADVIPWREGLHRRVIDGVRLLFQLTPGTEAPAEMNIYLPELLTLCMAENATHNLHNILSLRGAQVRDAHAWAKYLTDAIQTFGEHTEVEFASHHWPRWGKESILEFLSNQRDMYAYLNDQTLRLINRGYTGIEIAEELQHLPAGLADHYYNQGYYGSLSHNFKAVYQRYMGWFDGNPAHLWNLPPTAAGTRYVAAMGGAEAVVQKAQETYDGREGDPDAYRWVVELLNHVIFADPATVSEKAVQDAKALQAKTFAQLGYGAENGPWRNFYLTGAEELRTGPQRPAGKGAPDLVHSMTLEQVFAAMARSVDGPKAAQEQRAAIVLHWNFTDTQQECTTTLRNGVLVYVAGTDLYAGKPQATIALTRETFDSLLLEGPLFQRNFDAAVKAGAIRVDDRTAADTVFGYLTVPDPMFAIVAP
ncbi:MULTISPECIES: alkyl/aryl-sulfatase [Streptomyces]|uniref:MBL fold metallo-hydrolase n=2 Tax=Streptomyces rimosus subsp. rimosus TaxID=132474 RepID=L8EL94_STRR1|nr:MULTISPECIES: alkyl sulfatase dimerization domain-containing protein [Streptomyces]KOG84121.1 alkyl/aryl-sulfatase [Kitasatospora aureofaciens]MYT41198.1 MBL fold metallo-hydrolase [Streptomyces sp. SID5471]KEF07564.1 alkyl/aryl-sulfatase [Streptomyces rimosus]KEF20408.1 alkyl/aryl-sulfatase [Streptomyces rimosus]KOT27982.1 alkyl/aryl-sulfatase [Streptomyces sp. NRRL WC-3701]